MFLHPYEFEMLASEVAREMDENEAARRAIPAAAPSMARRNTQSRLADFWREACRRAAPRGPRLD